MVDSTSSSQGIFRSSAVLSTDNTDEPLDIGGLDLWKSLRIVDAEGLLEGSLFKHCKISFESIV